jgi:hypothetical protein
MCFPYRLSEHEHVSLHEVDENLTCQLFLMGLETPLIGIRYLPIVELMFDIDLLVLAVLAVLVVSAVLAMLVVSVESVESTLVVACGCRDCLVHGRYLVTLHSDNY